MTESATFHVAGHERTTIEALTDLGFAFDSPFATTTTLLDTVDGRLHRAGLRLQVIESARVDPDTPAAQVHDLRKDSKKLRYLLECFDSLLPKGAREKYVKRLKALQDNLSEHQDAEVHVHLLRAVATELHETGASADTIVAVGQLTERLDQQRHAARIEFAERFADYDTPATHRALDAMIDGIAE